MVAMFEQHLFRSIFAFALLIVTASTGFTQTSLVEETIDVIPNGEDAGFGFRDGSFIAVPIPFKDPTIGNGLAVGAGWLFSADKDSKTSVIGGGGFKTNNGSTGYALSANMSWNANRYSFSVLAANFDLKYDFTAGFFDVPVKQSGELYKAEASYGFSKEFSVGLGLQYAETTLSTHFAGSLPPEISASLDLDVFKYGLVTEWDRRDNDLYPTRGSRVTLDVFRGEVTAGTGQDYQKAVLQGSYFRPAFGINDVFGLSATLCKASDNAPFFDACSIGLTDGLRGFSVTEYIGDGLVSVQAEYRGRLGNSRFGYAAFAGAGFVNDTRSSRSGTHAAAGIGLRFRVSKSFPVDFSADATFNSDNETLCYIYVGQAF